MLLDKLSGPFMTSVTAAFPAGTEWGPTVRFWTSFAALARMESFRWASCASRREILAARWHCFSCTYWFQLKMRLSNCPIRRIRRSVIRTPASYRFFVWHIRQQFNHHLGLSPRFPGIWSARKQPIATAVIYRTKHSTTKFRHKLTLPKVYLVFFPPPWFN